MKLNVVPKAMLQRKSSIIKRVRSLQSGQKKFVVTVPSFHHVQHKRVKTTINYGTITKRLTFLSVAAMNRVKPLKRNTGIVPELKQPTPALFT